MRRNVVGSADQIDDPMGTRYHERNPSDHLPSASTSSRVTDDGGGSARMRRPIRLKRAMSTSMRTKSGRRAFDGWARTVESDVARHSMPVRSSWTPKLMSLAWVATPSRSSRRMKFG